MEDRLANVDNRGVIILTLIIVIALAVPAAAHAATPYHIIPRTEWGADATLLYTTSEPPVTTRDETQKRTSEPDTVTQRQKDCLEAQKLYPEEFIPDRTVRRDAEGRMFRWPLEYSKQVELLVVHHTAIQVTGDARSPEERMRALYELHSNGRGWGDIGYHYVIAEDGSIFEGKAGGDYVVGGHVYCGNVGTVGIALMGNFEIEQPTQVQMRSLQWLLDRLAKRYGIDPRRTVQFQGKERLPILGHRDLLSTDCPGYYVAETLGQIRTNVITANLGAFVRFPAPPKGKKTNVAAAREARLAARRQMQPNITPVGSTTIAGRPGGSSLFLVTFTAGDSAVNRRSRIGAVQRSSNRIGLHQELQGREIPVRSELLLPESAAAKESQTIRLRVEFPQDAGTYTLAIGEAQYTLKIFGRRTRTTESRIRSADPALPHSTFPLPSSPEIRIRLSSRENGVTSCGQVNMEKLQAQYRGALECTLVEGRPAIINTVALEDYLRGLAEEPDTEPYEKQRAFAIAARSYALYYTDPSNRKFPGMPYDGDDSPARFQSYVGIAFELRNPRWILAATSTAGQVLTVNGAVIKVPYFTADDGRTRSPEEAGWKNFPHSEIFGSKPDPWCAGMSTAGHGVGMSGCGAKGQANEGRTAEEILAYYYPGAQINLRRRELSP
jgi:uncharacterized protein YqiB (DUF1249 family)